MPTCAPSPSRFRVTETVCLLEDWTQHNGPRGGTYWLKDGNPESKTYRKPGKRGTDSDTPSVAGGTEVAIQDSNFTTWSNSAYETGIPDSIFRQPGPAISPQATRRIAYEVEDAIWERKDIEVCAAIGPDGRKILAKSGGRDSVTFTNDELEAMTGAAVFTHNHPDGWLYKDGFPQRKGSGFSDPDVMIAVRCQFGEMRVVSPGYRYSLKIPADFVDRQYEDFERIVNKHSRRTTDEDAMFQAFKNMYLQAKNGAILKSDFVARTIIYSEFKAADEAVQAVAKSKIDQVLDTRGFDAAIPVARLAEASRSHEIMLRVAKRFGWNYTREEYQSWQQPSTGSTMESSCSTATSRSPTRWTSGPRPTAAEDWTKIRGKRGSQNLWRDETGRQVYSRTEPGRRETGNSGGKVDAQRPSDARATSGLQSSHTETPEFRQRFGNSKIVTRDGRPLLVYRGVKDAEMAGTRDGEIVWREPGGPKPSELEAGYFFTPDINVARHYGTPVPYYLKAENPIGHEDPIQERPGDGDAIFRMRGNGQDISDAWEIAVFDPSQAIPAADLPGVKPLAAPKDESSVDSAQDRQDRTETPEFRRWFGDSKVVDADGKPLVVYHGTSDVIDQFDPEFAKGLGGFGGEGVFFTDVPEVASGYANQHQTLAVKQSLAADQAAEEAVEEFVQQIEAKTNTNAPTSSGNRTRWMNDLLHDGDITRDEYDRFFELDGANYDRQYEDDQEMPDATPNLVPVYLSLQHPLEIDAHGLRWDVVIPHHMQTVDRGKYDGIIFRNVKDAGDEAEYLGTTYVAFRPEQIKSATGNPGTFDPRSPRINESRTVREEVAFEGWVTKDRLVSPSREKAHLGESRQVTLFESCGWDGAALWDGLLEEWTPYHGPLGGKGWQWNGQGEPVYQDEMPGEPRESGGKSQRDLFDREPPASATSPEVRPSPSAPSAPQIRQPEPDKSDLGGGTIATDRGEREARYRDMRRSRKNPVVEFPKPIVGPSGAKLLSYEWKYTLYEDVDARGEERIRRVSDWDEAVGSDDTGRNIVHHFHISNTDGQPRTVSLESALKELGYLKRDAKSIGVTNIKTLASALKRRALAQVTVDQRESLQERFDAAMKETRQRVDGLSLPDITEEAGDEGLRKFRMGDAQQWKHGGQDLTPDDRKSLEREWRRNRLVEMFPLDLAQEAAGLDGRAGTEEAARSMIRYNQDLSSFRQETDKMKKKIGDLDRQIQILADEAAETAAGGVSGPEKHRAALRQLDEIWTTLQMGADGRKYADPVVAAKTHLKANGTENWNDRGRENGAYEMQEIVDDLKYLTGRAYDGRKTGKALLADETPATERYGKPIPAISASPDKKVTKWYMENKEAIDDVLQRLEKWKRQYRPDMVAESLVREGWITLNAGSGDDEQGGVRVYIDDGSGEVTAGPEGLMGKSFPEARGKSRPVAQLREPGETKAGAKPGDTQPGPTQPEHPKEQPPVEPPAEIGRSPGMPVLRFPQPIVGPSGARLESYEWKYTTEEDEEAGKRRVSDWAQAVGSDRTGRDIVHQFHVVDRDGNRKVVSLDSALKELGYVPADSKTAPVKGIKDLGTALKRRGLAQLELDRREDLQRRFDAALTKVTQEVEALPVPSIETIEDQDGFSRHRIGDVEQRQAQTGGLNDDVRKELEQEWRRRRMAERFPLDLGREAAEAVGLPGNDTEARAMASRGLRYFKDDTAKKRQQLRRLDQKIEELAGHASRMAESALCRQVTLFEAWSQHEGPRGGTYWLRDGDKASKTYRRPGESGRSGSRSEPRPDTTAVDRPTSYPVEARGQQYVVRPEAKQRDPHGRLEGDFTQRELAAHVLDRELNGRLVPRTEFVTAQGGKGARQPLVAGESPAALTDLPEATQQAVAAFDFIIGNANRRPDQVKVGPDGRAQLVSNGRAFYSNADLAEIGLGDAAQRPKELGGEGLAIAEMVLSYEDRLRPQLMLMLPDQQVDDVFVRAKMLIRNQRNLQYLFSPEGFAAALEIQQVGFPSVTPRPISDDPDAWTGTPPEQDIPEAMHDRAFVGADRYEEYAIRFNQSLRRELGQETPMSGSLEAERDLTPHWPAKIRRDVASRIEDPEGALDQKADQLLGSLGQRAEGLEGKTAMEKLTGAVLTAMNEPSQANRDLAQAIQYAAAERFGGQVPAWADRTLYDQQPELFHAIAQGIYDNTQNRLRAAGIAGMVLYRGVDLTAQPEEFRRLWDTAAAGRGAVRAVDGLQVNQQPVASWTQNPYLAHNAAVGYGSNRQMVLGAWVPAEKIFSLPFSGPGDAATQEVLTLGEYQPERTRAVLFNDWRYTLDDKHMMGALSAVGSKSHEWFWGEQPALSENPKDTTAPHEQRKREERTFLYAAGDEPELGLKVLRPHSVEQEDGQRVETYLAMDQRGGSGARTILLQVRAKPYRAAEGWTQHEGPRDGTYWIKDGDQSTKTYRRPNGEDNRRNESDDQRDTSLRGSDATRGGNGRLRAGAAGLVDVGLPSEVQPASADGATDRDLRGLDGATMKLAGVKLSDSDRESLARQGLYLHGTSADFTHFKPGGHGAIYLSSADSRGRVTQAEHIASGPFGGRLVAVKVDQSKLKKFDPLNDPESKRIWQTVFGDKPVRDYVDWPNMHLVVKAASPFGYNAFRVFEPAVQGMSFAVTDPTALQIVGDSRLPSKEPDQATTEVDDKAGSAWKSEVKALLPGVDAPLFHATTGPRAAQIYQQGVLAGQYSDFGQGNVGSISLTENLDWALEGHRGNYVLVFDRKDLSQQGELVPFHAPGVPNEFEQRFLKDAIPPSSIKGVIVNGHLATFMQKDAESWGFPVVYRDKQKGWTRIGGGVAGQETPPVAGRANISESGQARRPVVREILLDRDPGIAGWLHRYRVFQASEGWVEYKGPRGGTYYVKDGDRATKTYRRPQDMGATEPEPATPGADAAKPATAVGAPPEPAVARPSQTDTPEFKNWFGDSKIVDKDGKPLVVYHGTMRAFDEFDPATTGENTNARYGEGAIFFTSNPRVASDFAWREGRELRPEHTPNVVPVYLAMSNPKIIDAGGKSWLFVNEQVKAAKAEGYDGVIVRNVLDHASEITQREVGPIDTFVVFDPTKIKSAIGNRGTFDPKSRKITESVPLETHPLLHEGWVEYDGPLGGEGWKNTETGKVRYVEEMPGGREGKSEPNEPTSVKPQIADTATETPANRSPTTEAPTPIRFKVRGSGEWEWDGEAPVVKGPLGGVPHYRVTRLEDGRQGTLTSYGREGWRIDLDGDSSYRPVARGGGRNPIEAKQKAERQTETRSREGDQEAGEAGRKAALQMMDAALSDMRPLRQQADAMANDVAPRRAETTRIARESWTKVVNRFGPKALEAIGQVKKIEVYEDQAELAASLVRWDTPAEETSGIQGVYRHDDKTGELLLSGAGIVDPEGTYAHELTHAVDGPQSVYSSARKWRNAWKAEIGSKEENRVGRVRIPGGEVKELVGKPAEEVKPGDKLLLGDGVTKEVLSAEIAIVGRLGKVLLVRTADAPEEVKQWNPKATFYDVNSPEAPAAPLTRYAQTSASEGFAEFGRLLVADPERAKREFPKCWKCWREWHLVEEPTAGESAFTGRLREYVAFECLSPEFQLNKE